MKEIISSEHLFDVLSNIRKELDRVKGLNAIRVDSVLYFYIYNACFNVASAINHLDEFVED